jgi:hypothetical protein
VVYAQVQSSLDIREPPKLFLRFDVELPEDLRIPLLRAVKAA